MMMMMMMMIIVIIIIIIIINFIFIIIMIIFIILIIIIITIIIFRAVRSLGCAPECYTLRNIKIIYILFFPFPVTLSMRGRKDKMRYKSNVKLSSQLATVKGSTQAMVGSLAGKKRSVLLTMRSRLDYNLHALPGVRRNLVNLGLKVHDRSTASLRKYGVNL